MTTQEKLQHFYSTSVESARNEAKKELDAAREELALAMEQYTQKRTVWQQEEEHRKADEIHRQTNRKMNIRQMELRRRISQHQEEQVKQLFSEVRQMMDEFREDEAYLDYLQKKFERAINLAEGDEIRLYLSASDQKLAPILEERLGHFLEIDDSFVGGIRGEITARNLWIDESFDELIREKEMSFAFREEENHE